ncbi:MAG TPA: WGR domain-containing protein [Terriglobia bacterium]|nr:WGR domain-containing protein [Terriglobia bacterium]
MIRLENKIGNHFKFYELHLDKSNGHHTVKAIYGRIGQAGQSVVVYDGPSEQEAIGEMQSKQLEKQKKGYVIVSSNGQSSPASAEKKRLNSRQSGQ